MIQFSHEHPESNTTTPAESVPGPEKDTLFGMGRPPLRLTQGRLLIEHQAANGLRMWARHFRNVIWAIPLVPETEADSLNLVHWVPVDEIPTSGSLKVVPLPWVFDYQFFRQRSRVRQELRSLIGASRYCHIALSNWSGCWGRVAAELCIEQHVPYSLHLETVQTSVAWRSATNLKRRLKFLIYEPFNRHSNRKLLHHAAQVQCNGMDTFRHYTTRCSNTALIHNVHTAEKDLISPQQVSDKQSSVRRERPLKIRYAGRLLAMKGPIYWLKALAHAREQGTEFEASWMGEGEMVSEFLAHIRQLRLTDCVKLLPFESRRSRVSEYLQSADLLLFTHLTLESARVQKEALNRGTPIVGFRTDYAQDLISVAGGGELCPMHDYRALGQLVVRLDRHRDRLSDLVQKAATDGRRFTASSVFAQRARGIREAIDAAWERQQIQAPSELPIA